jgi:endonuclease/exonuclease/phosphatase (EEP) superfamily protein YafD
MFAINACAFYLFLPIPLIALASALSGKWLVVVALLLESGMAFYHWSRLLVPKRNPPSSGNAFKIATYNALEFNLDHAGVVAAISGLDADFIAIQELNPEVAEGISAQLSARYPFQALHPGTGYTGAGLLSKSPFLESKTTIPDEDWVSPPRIAGLQFRGVEVTIVAIHLAKPQFTSEHIRQADKIADFARKHAGPLLVLGDFNATSTNTVYSRIRCVLRDVWLEAGSGLGHTFPGASQSITPKSSRPRFLGVSMPRWLLRIDFVFYSAAHWRPVGASLGDDGGSDHRPMMAMLDLMHRDSSAPPRRSTVRNAHAAPSYVDHERRLRQLAAQDGDQ